jgi:hypothetical protein
VIVLNHAAHLALKATEAVIASKIVRLHHALKVALRVAAISAQKDALSHAANNAALHLAVAKAALSPAAISALTIVALTASKHATIATAVFPALQALQAAATMPVVVQAIASHPVAPKSSVLVTSSHTTLAVMQHPSALAPKC